MIDIIAQSVVLGFGIVAALLIMKRPAKALAAHLTFMKHFGEAEHGLEPQMFKRDGWRYTFAINKVYLPVKFTKLIITELSVNNNTVTGLKFNYKDDIYPNFKSLKEHVNFGLDFTLKHWTYLNGELILNNDVIEYHTAMLELEKLMKTIHACAIYISKNINTGDDPIEYTRRYRK